MSIINDKEMAEEMVSDLIESYEYTEEEAKDWVEENGSSTISNMWDAYCRYMEENAVYKG